MNENIIFMHAEDTAALWCRRDAAVYRGDLNHAEQKRLDGRVRAHVHGLQLAGEAGFATCADLLDMYGGPGELFTAGIMALADGREAWLERVLRACLTYGHRRALASAMGLMSFEQIDALASRFVEARDPLERWLGVSAFALHRRDPGAHLHALLDTTHPEVCGRALQAVGELGRADLRPMCLEIMGDASMRGRAAIALARLGDGCALVRAALVETAEDPALGREAIGELVELQPPAAGEHIVAWRRTKRYNHVIAAVEALGGVGYAPELVGYMGDELLARRAGEAFSVITGINLREHDLDAEPPSGYCSGPNDDPFDPRVEIDPDHHLAWPSQMAVARRWQREQANFDRIARYLAGENYGWIGGSTAASSHQDVLVRLVQYGRRTHRLHAARALGGNRSGWPRVEVRAFLGGRNPLPGLACWLGRPNDPALETLATA